MKKWIITVLLALGLCALALSGGDSLTRKTKPASGQETVETQTEAQSDAVVPGESTEEVEEVLPNESFEEDKAPASEDDIQEEPSAAKIVPVCASLASQGSEEILWSTEDDVYSQRLYDILDQKEESVSEEELGDSDYIVLIGDDAGEEYCYLIWGDLSSENELIVEDDLGECWKLSVEDSNHLRSIINGI